MGGSVPRPSGCVPAWAPCGNALAARAGPAQLSKALNAGDRAPLPWEVHEAAPEARCCRLRIPSRHPPSAGRGLPRRPPADLQLSENVHSLAAHPAQKQDRAAQAAHARSRSALRMAGVPAASARAFTSLLLRHSSRECGHHAQQQLGQAHHGLLEALQAACLSSAGPFAAADLAWPRNSAHSSGVAAPQQQHRGVSSSALAHASLGALHTAHHMVTTPSPPLSSRAAPAAHQDGQDAEPRQAAADPQPQRLLDAARVVSWKNIALR